MVGNDHPNNQPICYINGKFHRLPLGRGEATLLTYLRECGLTGTKLGCGEGGCGACTVMISRSENGEVGHKAVNACLFPLYAADGAHVITVEGIGNTRDGLHPVQKRLSEAHGSQCGFCTPGFVMSMYSLLRSKGTTCSEVDIEECLAGNLCRCTGYRPILDAFRTFALPSGSDYSKESIEANASSSDGLGKDRKLCPSTGQPCNCGMRDNGVGVIENNNDATLSTQSDLIFPAELQKWKPTTLELKGNLCCWHRPISLEDILLLKHKLPHAKIVVGNTEVGIEMKFKHAGYTDLIDANHIPELCKISSSEGGITVGASVSLTRLMDYCKLHTKNRNSILACIHEQLRWFAGNQIRNVACLGGNVATGSPISDLNPLLIAGRAVFRVIGINTGKREIPAANFFLQYRTVDMKPHEVLYEIYIPTTQENEFVKQFKQARRREDDIAIVTAGMRVKLNAKEGQWMVESSSISYGGVAAKTISARAVEESLNNKVWSLPTLKAAMQALRSDVIIPPSAPGGMSEFRCSLAASFLFKFLLHVSHSLGIPIPSACSSSLGNFDRPISKGIQYYAEGMENDQVLGQSMRHTGADSQVSGESQYTDDVPILNCLHAALVTSSVPHAHLISVDAFKAMAMPGVVGFYCHKDVPGSNSIGAVVQDEEVFASKTVTCVGQVIGVVVAETQALAQRAARCVDIQYEEQEAVLTISDAVKAQEFFDAKLCVECGNVDGAFSECSNVVEGEFTCGGQEHFYLEPQTCIVVPADNDELLMTASTQAPYSHVKSIAAVIGIPEHKVVCKTKRIGGGFGGKETRSIFLNAAVAVAAYLQRKPVRLCLDRDEDMQITGHRHAFLCKYKVSFDDDMRILGADLHLYSNAGNSLDLSKAVMTRALLHSDTAYKIPNMRVKGTLCRTNTPSNTAFRGFGGPQGSILFEMCIERIAHTLGVSCEEMRAKHLYSEGDRTHFGQKLENCNIQRCWNEVMTSSDYYSRLTSTAEFNQKNRFRKRGIAVTPVKFGIAFTTLFLNQGGALVHIYTDGSVLITHGGVEMGQGLHTKMCQVAAEALKVPFASVHVSETATDKVPNASPTAASASSDLYGGAVLDACTQLNDRLAPIRNRFPHASMEVLAKSAWLERVDLSAHGFYRTPDITGSDGPHPFSYFCYGAACSEVEVDVLTGDWHALRVDITMDVGNPMNPAIDIGQVEGGFIQGMGWLCMEELVWGDSNNPWIRKGHLHTAGPGTYKIPTANDIPIDMRVSLLKNSGKSRAIHSSKAVGEPPFLLANSVFFALKNAIYAARSDAGIEGWFRMDPPSTAENIRTHSGCNQAEHFIPELDAILPS